MLENYVLEVIDHKIQCYISYSKKSKYLKLVVQEGRVIVSIPHFISYAVAVDFIQQKQKWILKKYQQEQFKRDNITLYWPSNIVSGVVLFFRGEPHQLLLNYQEIKVKEIALIVKNEYKQLCFIVPISYLGNDSLIKQKLHYELGALLLSNAEELISRYVLIIGKQPTEIRIKTIKSLWGSCSSNAKITLNWSLIFAPKSVLEYIIVHEMSHLKYLNHSANFWRLVEKCLPAYAISEKWLKKHSWILDHNFLIN